MQHAKKMALVPQELLDTVQLQQNQMINPVTKMLSSLDKEMQQVLDRTDIPDDEKAKLYQQTLQQYRAYSDKKKEPVKISIVPTTPSTPSAVGIDQVDKGQDPPLKDEIVMDGVEQDVLESVPKSLQKKARLLLQKIKQHGAVAWNEKGELTYDGNPLPGTHMVDLVNDVLRRRKTFTPTGWPQFSQVLSAMNVPQDLVGNKERWKFMQSVRSMKPLGSVDHNSDLVRESANQPSVKRKRVVSTPMKPRHRPKGWVRF